MQTDRKELKGLRVLVVEDDNKYLNLIASMLRRMGIMDIYSAQTGGQALEIMNTFGQTAPIDLIMCDWTMPEMDGLEFLRQVRRTKSTLPFLMVTGSTNEELVLAAKSLDVTSFLAKPFTFDELKKKLVFVMRKSTEKTHDVDWFHI